MHRLDNTAVDPQVTVNAYFRKEASYWADIYQRPGIKELIHQERLRAALAMAAGLHPEPGSRALDVGCGAGLATVGLARHGFLVDAVDPVEAMIEQARRRALDADVVTRVTVRLGDVRALPFPDGRFDLVLALGVLPWLPQLDKPLQELSRVLRPDGHLIATVDLLWQLRQLADPLLTPLLQGPRRLAGRILGRPTGGARAHVTSLRGFRRALAARDLQEVAGLSLGFGPFTLFRRELLPRPLGLKLHRRLQCMAQSGVPVIRSCGSQYLVLARKCGAGSNNGCSRS